MKGPVVIEVEALAAEMFKGSLWNAIMRGDREVFRVSLLHLHEISPGGTPRHEQQYLDVPEGWATPGAWGKIEDLPGFSEWKWPMDNTEVLLFTSVLGGRVRIPLAVLEDGEWRDVELAWPKEVPLREVTRMARIAKAISGVFKAIFK